MIIISIITLHLLHILLNLIMHRDIPLHTPAYFLILCIIQVTSMGCHGIWVMGHHIQVTSHIFHPITMSILIPHNSHNSHHSSQVQMGSIHVYRHRIMLMHLSGVARAESSVSEEWIGLTGTVTDVTQIVSKTHLSVWQYAPQDTTADIQLYYT